MKLFWNVFCCGIYFNANHLFFGNYILYHKNTFSENCIKGRVGFSPNTWDVHCRGGGARLKKNKTKTAELFSETTCGKAESEIIFNPDLNHNPTNTLIALLLSSS